MYENKCLSGDEEINLRKNGSFENKFRQTLRDCYATIFSEGTIRPLQRCCYLNIRDVKVQLGFCIGTHRCKNETEDGGVWRSGLCVGVRIRGGTGSNPTAVSMSFTPNCSCGDCPQY